MTSGWPLALIAAVACGKSTVDHRPVAAAPRSRPALVRDVTAFAAKARAAADDRLPRAGDADYVRPPDEGELAWIDDRAQPLDDRMNDALALLDQLRALMHVYSDRDVRDGQAHPDTAKDSAESLGWAEAAIRASADLDEAAIGEVLPALPPDDPSYATRLDGLRKMGTGQVGMIQGTLITLHARRVDVATRASLLAAWQQHVATFQKVWSADDCTKIQGWITEVVVDEPDAGLTHALQALAKQLAGCRGLAR